MLSSSWTIGWQDVAAWVTVLIAAGYVLRFLRGGEGQESTGCATCSHCPMREDSTGIA